MDGGAAALLALAIGIASSMLAVDPAAGFAAAALGGFAAFYRLRSIGAEECAFALTDFEPLAAPADELLLTEADRVQPGHERSGGEVLLLDRALLHVGEGARVVRLFEPSTTFTPGELQARIGRHFADVRDARAGSAETPPHDASQALFEALAELKRSLR